MKPFALRGLWGVVAALCYASELGIALAEIPSELEPLYAEAVLAYNAADHNRALRILDEIRKKAPAASEVLELKALVMKASQPKQSAEVYRELIKLKIAEKRPAKEIAPYYFELATMKFEAKSYSDAAVYFQRCTDTGFNVSASEFFLGLIAYQSNEFSKADDHFKVTATGDVAALRPAANFYRAQAATKMNQSGRSISYLSAARDSAKEVLDDPNASPDNLKMAKQIHDAAVKALGPMDRSSWFGSATLMAGFDSNILTLPENVSGSSASGKGTPKGTIQAGVGYTTSPLKKWQWVPNYRVSWNKNTNKDSRSAEYLLQTASLYVTHRPLNPFNFGFKAEATHTFQNTVDASTDSATYRPLSLNISTGPFFRKEVLPKIVWGGEVLFEPNHYYTDDQQPSNGRLSGTQLQVRSYLQNDRGTRYFNPTVYLSLLRNDSDGEDYRQFGATIGVLNTFYVHDKLKVQGSLDFGMSSYGERSTGGRNDRTLNFGLNATQRMNRKLSWIADFRFTMNQSNIKESYEYKRFVTMGGISYSLF